MANPSFNPSQWRSGVDPAKPGVFQNFMKQLSDWGNWVNSQLNSQAIANFLNTMNLLANSALLVVTKDLGIITTDQTVAASGAQSVFVRLTSSTTQTRTITISNLAQGARVMINAVVTAGTLTLKLAASDTAGNTYTIQSWTTTSAAQTDMVGTGLAVTVESNFFGMSGFVSAASTPRLNLYYV